MNHQPVPGSIAKRPAGGIRRPKLAKRKMSVRRAKAIAGKKVAIHRGKKKTAAVKK